MKMQRAYSLLTIKEVDDEKRELTGIATTPTTDRGGDIVEPKGAEFDLPLPFLWQHNSREPIGHVTHAKVTRDGIEVKVKLVKTDEPGTLKDRLDEAWQSIKLGLVRGLSIGFQSLESSRIEDTFGLRFIKWLWLELSAVTIPANAEASILTVRSFDQAGRAASGTQTQLPIVRLDSKGPASRQVKPTAEEAKSMKTIAEQIQAWEAKRASLVERLNSLMEKSVETGETLDGEEDEQYTQLSTEIKSVDKQLDRLRDFEKIQATKAKPPTVVDVGVGTALTTGSALDLSGGGRISIKDTQLPPGIEFAQYVKCLANAQGDPLRALEIAKHHYPNMGRIQTVLKAAVAAGTTTDSTWAGPLVEYNTFAGDFLNYLRPATILGKFGQNGVPDLRRVPFNVRILGQSSGGAGYWVGQGAPKPLTKVDFDARTLGFAKVANIAVLSQELLRFSSPNADALVRDALRDAIVERIDRDFIDPTKTAVANVSPASITNGATTFTSSGTTSDAVRADVAKLFGVYIAANLNPASAVWIMSSLTALNLSMMTTPLGTREFPNISMNGGEFAGLPVIVSQYVQNSATTGSTVVLVSAEDVFLADDGTVVIDASREASLEMLDNPTNNAATPTATTMVSMFQTNSVAIRAERFINWAKRRTAAVAYLTQVLWNGHAT